jgi:RHS repeat-associated protein
MKALRGGCTLPIVRELLNIYRIGDRIHSLYFNATHYGIFSYDQGKRVVGIDWFRSRDDSLISSERNLYGAINEWKLHQIQNFIRLNEHDKLLRLIKATDYIGAPLIDISSLNPASSEAGLGTVKTQLEIDNIFQSIQSSLMIAPANHVYTYELDINTNRLKTKESSSTGSSSSIYIPEIHNRYRSIGGSNILYDRKGNIIEDGSNKYYYDAFNRLSKIETPSGQILIYYDAIGRMVKMIKNNIIEEFIFSGLSIIERYKDGSLTEQIIPFERPNLVAHVASVVGGNNYDYAPIINVIGSTQNWIRSDESESNINEYDPFGQKINSIPNAPIPTGFGGYWYEELSRTYHLFARDYHPQYGIFLQRDPLNYIDIFNTYSFSRHSPGTFIDYFGFISNEIDWGIVGKEAGLTIGTGVVMGLAAAGAVAIGLVSAPILAIAGVVGLIGMGLLSIGERQNEALEAGITDAGGRAFLAGIGDALCVSPFVEGIGGHSIVTGDPLGRERRSRTLGGGIGGGILFAAGVGLGAKKFGRRPTKSPQRPKGNAAEGKWRHEYVDRKYLLPRQLKEPKLDVFEERFLYMLDTTTGEFKTFRGGHHTKKRQFDFALSEGPEDYITKILEVTSPGESKWAQNSVLDEALLKIRSDPTKELYIGGYKNPNEAWYKLAKKGQIHRFRKIPSDVKYEVVRIEIPSF